MGLRLEREARGRGEKERERGGKTFSFLFSTACPVREIARCPAYHHVTVPASLLGRQSIGNMDGMDG